MTTELVPAIDLRGGRCVRLYQGDYARETVYGDDPAAMAQHWVEQGATRLHVVDLDGARDGEQRNASAVASIVASVSIPVELGGGIRDDDSAARWLDAGVERVFLGTAAITDPPLVERLASRYPGRIAAGADARNGRIAVRGWEQDGIERVTDFARRCVEAGVCAVAYTDVSRDGTLEGPNLEELRRVIEALPVGHNAQVILAGGIGTLDHVLASAMVPGLDAVIMGRALYEGTVELPAALAALAQTRR